MSEPDDTERVQKVDPEEASASEGGSNGKNGTNGHAHKASAEPEGKANVKIEASRDSGREKSVEDALEAFITRANTQAIEEFDGWGVAGDKDAERPQGTPAPELLNKSTLVGRPAMPDDKVGKQLDGKKRKPSGTPKNGSAIQAHAAVAAQAAEIALRKAPPEDIDIDTDDDGDLAAKPAAPVSDKTEVVAKLPRPPVVAAPAVAAAPPVVVKKGLGLPALLVAFAAGAVVVFFAVRMTMKKDSAKKDPGVNAAPTAPADPTGSAAAPGPVAAPVSAGAPADPAPAAVQPDPTAVAAPAPVVEPLAPAPAAAAAPAPVVEPLAPAPTAASAPAPVVEPAPAPIVTPLPVEAKKPTSKPAAKPVAAKPVAKPAAVKGSIADPFATPAQKPASKPTKSTPKKTTPKKAGGIVDPFAN